MGAGYVIMVGNIAQPLASLIKMLKLKLRRKRLCVSGRAGLSARRRNCPKLFMLVLKNRGWVGWRFKKILKTSEGSCVNFSYSKNYVQYPIFRKKNKENMERKCNRGSREMECVDINRKHPTNCLLF